MDSNFDPKEARSTLRMLVGMDPSIRAMARRGCTDRELMYIAGRLHGALFKAGVEKLDPNKILDVVREELG